MLQEITVTRKQADKRFADLGETLRGIAAKMDSAKVEIKELGQNYNFELDHKYGKIRVALRDSLENEWEVVFSPSYNKLDMDHAGVRTLEKWGKKAGFEHIINGENLPDFYPIWKVPLKDAKRAIEVFIPESDSVCKAREAYIKKLNESVK